MDLFSKQNNLPLPELGDYKPPVKKIIQQKEKKDKKPAKVSCEDIPMFKSEEERKKYFPNPPKSLKELKRTKIKLR